MRHKQLTFMREYRGITQTQLAKEIKGLQQSNLSKYEKGIDVLSDELVNKITDYLQFPKEFLDRRIDISIDNANYRKRMAIAKTEINKFDYKSKIIGYIIDELSNSLEWVEPSIMALNVEDGYTPTYIAKYIRKQIKKIEGPIENIINALESKGVIVIEVNAIDKFDGVSFITSNGFPVIIINKKMSNDRKRFTIAHELGHLIMHNDINFPISTYRDKEKEANEFAAEFLMPEAEIRDQLSQLKMSSLADIKSYWLTSMSSIIRRAKDLNCIDTERYTYLNIEMSRHGYTKKEPNPVNIDKPVLFYKMYEQIKTDLKFESEDFVSYFALPKDVIDEVFNLKTYTSKIKIA